MQNAENQPQKPPKKGRGRPKKGHELPKFNPDEDAADSEVFEGPTPFSTKRAHLIGHKGETKVWCCWVRTLFYLETPWGIDQISDRRALELLANPEMQVSPKGDRIFHAALAVGRSTRAQLFEISQLLREKDPVLSFFYLQRATNKT